MGYILRYIDRSKIEPHLCVFDLTGKEAALVPAGIPVYSIHSDSFLAPLVSLVRLVRLIRRLRPGTVLSHLWRVNVIASIAGRLTRTPVTVVEHVVTHVCLPAYSFSFLRKKLLHLSFSLAQRIVAVSGDVKESLAGYFHVPADKIEVILNGIDIREIETKAAESFDRPKGDYIISCGRLVDQKNFGLLIRAAADLNEQKKAGASLVILGVGEKRASLESLARSLGVTLIMPGFADNPYPWIKNAKVFALSSLYEGLPTVLLEAMACRTPVVSTACPGGINEVLENNATALIVPVNDRKALAAALGRVWEDRTLAGSLARNAYSVVKNRFAVETMVQKYETLLVK